MAPFTRKPVSAEKDVPRATDDDFRCVPVRADARGRTGLFDAVVSVPLHRARLREGGFN